MVDFTLSNIVRSVAVSRYTCLIRRRHSPFWICGANFGMTHSESLMVFTSVQYLIAIELGALIIQKFEFCAMGLKTTIQAPF